ncbi:DUF3465 domain-containing protein [Acetobacteraceae bacterium]|nr:DUF3465 domain-containing protein [Acetobacteraceae bacterium]
MAVEMPANCDNSAFLKEEASNAQNYFQRRAPDMPVHICGEVTRTFPAKKTRSGRHFYFLLNIVPHKAIRIVVNLDEMQNHRPYIRVGDRVEVQGRYYYDNPHSQGVDWTHHGTSQKWGWPGFVAVNGQKFD